MAELLKGAPVAEALNAQTRAEAERLRAAGTVPTLAILRVGAREDDLAYERGAVKRCAQVGVETRSVPLPAGVDADTFFQTLDGLNRDGAVHGILMLRPLPKHLHEARACALLSPEKDVDGCTAGSLAGVFTGTRWGFPPCTAQAAMELLRFYRVPLRGRRAVVAGRSLVVGRPLAMLLLAADATVTLCHSRTENLAGIAREADLLVTAMGRTEAVGPDFLCPGQTVVDVGIGWNAAKGRLCGDVDFDAAEGIVQRLTPVPGGVGSVTTGVLAAHVVEAARRACQ